MKITVLGTGTSTGVPLPGCSCKVCKSGNPKNNRLRCSIFVEPAATASGDLGRGILVDTSTDLRTQALRYGFSLLDAVIYTHAHADHIFGIDDLRSFNFTSKTSVPLYASEKTAETLLSTFRYCFFTDPEYQGGSPPQLSLEKIQPMQKFSIAGCEIIAIPVFHGKMEVFAFRFGDFAYATDCSSIPAESVQALKGLKYLILDGLRERPHATHFTIDQAIEMVSILKPQKTYLTHISHELEHEETNASIKARTTDDIELAYDGLQIIC